MEKNSIFINDLATGKQFGQFISKLDRSFAWNFFQVLVKPISIIRSRSTLSTICLDIHGSPGALGRMGGGPGVGVSTVAFHARVRGSFPSLGDLKETFQKIFLPHPLLTHSIIGNLRDRPQTARVRISNPVPGGQCHLTILRRFSWSNLAVCAQKWPTFSFHFFIRKNFTQTQT